MIGNSEPEVAPARPAEPTDHLNDRLEYGRTNQSRSLCLVTAPCRQRAGA